MGNFYRTPNSSNSNNEYNVNPTGANDNNNANNSNGAVPDYKTSQFQVGSFEPKAEQPCRERLSSLCYKEQKSDGLCAVPFSYVDLFHAVRECKAGVNWKDSVAGFSKNRFANCEKLYDQILNGKYGLFRYNCFTIHEPKTREIVATHIRDRVVQRALCNTYLYDALTKGFVDESFACLVNKGTTNARTYLRKIMQNAYEDYLDSAYICKIDIKNYFGSIDHDLLKKAVKKRVDNLWARNYVYLLIDSFDPVIQQGVGIGLGSQISQLLALTFLDDIDHKIKEQFGVKYYIRYMDDFILICKTKEHAKNCLKQVTEELNKLKLNISPKKSYIAPLSNSINFLGFRYRLHKDGFVSMQVLSNKAGKERRKLIKQLAHFPVKQIDDSFRSWKANVKQGTSYKFVQKMNSFYYYNRRKYVDSQNDKTTYFA